MLTVFCGVENATSTAPSLASKNGTPVAKTDTTFGLEGAHESGRVSTALTKILPLFSGLENVMPGYRLFTTVPSGASSKFTVCAQVFEQSIREHSSVAAIVRFLFPLFPFVFFISFSLLWQIFQSRVDQLL
jgi:hypothetical protein